MRSFTISTTTARPFAAYLHLALFRSPWPWIRASVDGLKSSFASRDPCCAADRCCGEKLNPLEAALALCAACVHHRRGAHCRCLTGLMCYSLRMRLFEDAGGWVASLSGVSRRCLECNLGLGDHVVLLPDGCVGMVAQSMPLRRG